MNSYSKRITEITVGAPPPLDEGDDDEYSDVVRVCFADFALLPHDKAGAAGVATPKFECLGKSWVLTLYPGGEEGEGGDIGIKLTLCDEGDEITICYDINVVKTDGTLYPPEQKWDTFEEGKQGMTHGWSAYLPRGEILDPGNKLIGEDGALRIQVGMKWGDFRYELAYEPFLPPNPFLLNMQKMFPFMDADSSDLTLVVEDNRDGKSEKTRFPVHSVVLEASGTSLFPGRNSSAIVEISDSRPLIIRYLLRNIYGYKVPARVLKENAKDFIDAGDKYEVVNLKLMAEAWYCKSTKIGLDNVMENLQYADSKNLALLKEKVMEFMLENGKEVVTKLSLDDLPSSSQSFRDILTAANMKTERDDTGDYVTDINAMAVDSLRRKLHDEGLGVDGTREMLVAALERRTKGTKRSQPERP